MTLLNLGIVAHVDAGKTSLTERLLFEAGVRDTLGRVDDGTTVTDSMDLERRRGITIRAAVTTFPVDDLTVTIIDTPGHPDFIAEVERSLSVLDAAVLVLSAVEGVQPQTVVLWRALRRIGVPTVLFVNKVDRSGADVARVIDDVRRRLSPYVVPLVDVQHQGRSGATVHELSVTSSAVIEALAEVDDGVLAAYVEDRPIAPKQLADALGDALESGRAAPVLAGSAVTGAGIAQLRRALVQRLPRPTQDPGAASGTVFAVDHDDDGRRVWVRLWSGVIRVRDRIEVGDASAQLVTGVAVSRPGGLRVDRSAKSGEIAVLRGLSSARIGDPIGAPPERTRHRFAPAILQALVEPVERRQRSAMFSALAELADEDPLIDLRLDPASGEAAVSLHGEVQKEVIAAVLLERFGVEVRFLPTSTICIERVVGTGRALEQIKTGGNPYLATIGLSVRAAPQGHGLEFSPGIERGNLPPAFIAATEEGVRQGAQQGLLGWQVTDCVVTMTESGYCPRQSRPHQKFDKSISSVAGDFRHLAPVVLHAALREAVTRVCWPIDRFELDVPDAALGSVTALIGRLGGLLAGSAGDGRNLHLTGHLPSARVPDLASRLPDLTGGEALLITEPDHYAPAPGEVPRQRRHGPDPADRETWFRDVPR